MGVFSKNGSYMEILPFVTRQHPIFQAISRNRTGLNREDPRVSPGLCPEFFVHANSHYKYAQHICVAYRYYFEKNMDILPSCNGYSSAAKGGRIMNWIYMKGIPIEAQYLYRKALEHAKLERYETAVRYFRQAVVIAPRYSKALYEMGNCLTYLGQYDEAIALYNRALHTDPRIDDARTGRDRAINIRDLEITGNKCNGNSTI